MSSPTPSCRAVDAPTESAEVAIVLRDDWQGKGLGTYLLQRHIEIAQTKGIRKFQAAVLCEKSAMFKDFHRSGLRIRSASEGDVVWFYMTLPEPGNVSPSRGPKSEDSATIG